MMTDDATNTPASPVKPPEPYFIVPPGFRPNTFFVGLGRELTELDKRLFGRRRRDGTACVLLYGQPGGGKSHLAREYVNKNRKKFPGGIFWISAKSVYEICHAFSDIMQKVMSRDYPELCDGVNGDNYVQLVKNWFEGRHEWLMVFDGITVDKDENATELSKFIPDSKDSSIIYVSRARNLEAKQRLLRPIPIKVGPLQEQEARKLLFKELHIKKPTEAQNTKATELVRKVGGLPLAINAISRRLADTREPLTKYKLSTSADPTIEGTYNAILDDLQRLGYMQAWNLISVLCWFAQELPFEMVHLGLKILKADAVDVRAKEGTGKPDIDNTIAILMRYALLERNDPGDKESASSSRDSLNEPEPIDMLKIHTVLQNYCCESLNDRGMLPKYLGHAVKMFSYSYHQADVRIKLKPEPGRVSDYRYYETHGQWLWNHAIHYERRDQSLQSIKDELRPTLDRIGEEIRLREPGSSQESLQNGIFQISIFDRTSSSSDTGPIGPPTPNYRPTPPPLANETPFGFPIGKPMDSPASVETASPGILPKIVGNSPRLPVDDDIGYESDRSGGHRKNRMQRDLSEMTSRPSTPPRRSRAPTSESHGGEWQVVRNPRKQPRGRRDLGSFRPTPARAQINRQTAIGSIQRSAGKKENRRGSSPAFHSLESVQSRSPPQSRAGVASIFQRGVFNRPSTAALTGPTWAGVAAGQVEQPAQQVPFPSIAETIPRPPVPMDRPMSRSTSRTRPDSPSGARPSPLASEFLPRESRTADPRASPAFFGQPNEYPPAGFQTITPYPGSNASLAQMPQERPIITSSQSYHAPRPFGPNPAPLPYDDNITFTSKRPLPPDFRTEHQQSPLSSPASQQAASSVRTSPYQQSYDPPYPPTIIPPGYYSQPMSRDPSQLSHFSTALTDPTRYPSSFSPQLLPTYPDSPRDRHPDGRPLRKSPKTEFAIPTYHQQPPSRISPHDVSHTGGWAYSPSPSHQYDGTMSRSSSGPGVAIDGTPGGIVSFSSPGSVQFGAHEPLSIEEARRRTVEHEQKLREKLRKAEVEREMREETVRERKGEEWERRKEEGERGEERPYPDVNLIPTVSDGGALGRMAEGDERRSEGAVGLGVDMGRQGRQ